MAKKTKDFGALSVAEAKNAARTNGNVDQLNGWLRSEVRRPNLRREVVAALCAAVEVRGGRINPTPHQPLPQGNCVLYTGVSFVQATPTQAKVSPGTRVDTAADLVAVLWGKKAPEPVAEVEEKQEPGPLLPFVPDGLSIRRLIDKLGEVSEEEVLGDLHNWEAAHKNRPQALEAIDSRMNEIAEGAA